MLKVLQARLQQYVNQEFQHVQAGFRKGRGTRDHIANIHRIIEKAREFQKKKKSTSASLSTLTPLIVWITTNWKILKDIRISDHLTCLSWNLCADQEPTVRIRHGKMDWFKIGKGVLHQGCILSPCVFSLYAQCIMQNARLNDSKAGFKIAGRNINNLQYSDDTTLMTES